MNFTDINLKCMTLKYCHLIGKINMYILSINQYYKPLMIYFDIK